MPGTNTEKGIGERVETIDQKVELQKLPCGPKNNTGHAMQWDIRGTDRTAVGESAESTLPDQLSLVSVSGLCISLIAMRGPAVTLLTKDGSNIYFRHCSILDGSVNTIRRNITLQQLKTLRFTLSTRANED